MQPKHGAHGPATGPVQGGDMTVEEERTGGLAERRGRLVADLSLRGAAFADAWRSTVDAWLIERFDDAVGSDAVDDGTGLALVAVGGYGRGDLAPGSDLDLLLLHDHRLPPAALAEQIWYPIWDEGVKLGHAVRTRDEAIALADEDLDTATSLLTVRHLAGDVALTDGLAATAADRWRRRSRRSLGLLDVSIQDRHERTGEVAFLLEPDLKEGRGGLRDIHALWWASRARTVLEGTDEAELDAAASVLFDTRVALHRVAGRATERLTLQDQDAVAAQLGVDADGLMQSVARAARTVTWISDEAWDRVRATTGAGSSLLGWRSRQQTSGLVVRRGQVDLDAEVDPADRPELVLVAAELAARKRARLSRATLDRLAARAPAPVWDDELRGRFVDLLAKGHDAVRVIESLDAVSIWERYLPEWELVRSLPQRNAYHRFTVDRHLLEATANAAALVDRVDRPDLLLVGTLLHDIGKGRPGDHIEVGIELVATIAPRMGFDETDTAILSDLVRLHLLLPDVATRRDLDDPATIAGVADAVGDRLRLHLLAALTEADSLATGPAAWGAWKADLMGHLVRRVDHALQGGGATALVVNEFPSEAQLAVMASGETVVEGDGDRLTVVAADRHGLFSQVTGVLALHGLQVRSADAAAVDGMAIETFTVTSPFGPLIAWDRVADHVHAALEHRLAIDARLAERARTYREPPRAPSVAPPVVRFDDAASATSTVVEVHAPDRSGLLYRVARTLADFDLDVSVAKVQTSGHLVVDVFYVTDAGGGLVVDPTRRQELERALIHAAG